MKQVEIHFVYETSYFMADNYPPGKHLDFSAWERHVLGQCAAPGLAVFNHVVPAEIWRELSLPGSSAHIEARKQVARTRCADLLAHANRWQPHLADFPPAASHVPHADGETGLRTISLAESLCGDGLCAILLTENETLMAELAARWQKNRGHYRVRCRKTLDRLTDLLRVPSAETLEHLTDREAMRSYEHRAQVLAAAVHDLCGAEPYTPAPSHF